VDGQWMDSGWTVQWMDGGWTVDGGGGYRYDHIKRLESLNKQEEIYINSDRYESSRLSQFPL